ncbi:MAG: YbaN family protein [Bacteroidales bacterium]|nr:YbaN family protein [Bacteroidales bacterium]
MPDIYKSPVNGNQRNPIIRFLFLVSGLIAVFLGFAGIFVPLLPTTPFLLLASWCFVRSSERMNQRLMHNRFLGPYISNYKSGHGITRRNKLYSLAFLWITLSISFISGPPHWWLRMGLLAIGTVVTIHILRFKTLRENQ